LADLTPELRALLNEWDPIGVADLHPDEYDGLNGSILGRLGRNEDDRASFCEFMMSAAADMAPGESAYAFGGLVFDWFQSKTPGVHGRRPQLRKGRRYRSSHWNKP